MIIVEFPNIVETFKRAMHEVLSSYFNGTTHTINDVDVEFPQARIAFDPQDLTRPNQLTIVLIGENEISSEVLPCHNPRQQNMHGHEMRSKLTRMVHILSPDKNAEKSDEAWGLLWSVLETQYAAFAERNIFFPHIDAAPKDIVERTDFVEAVGIFSYELRVKFARYNT